jgi:general secretion pathway protein G
MDKHTHYRTLGFTLIELLVVVSIIAVLASFGMISYTSIQKNTRDAKRQADLNTIRSALEQYHADWGYYPESLQFPQQGQPNSGLIKRVSSNDTRTYLSELPTEPKLSDTQKQYCYSTEPARCDNSGTPRTTKCNRYKLYAVLERGGTEMSCGNLSGYNYMVTLP